jgi:hypothetical protein
MRSAVRFVCLTAVIALGLGSGAGPAHAAQPPAPDQAPQQADDQPPLASLVEDAQAPDDQPPAGHVSTLDGAARLDREGESSDVERGLPLVDGDRLRTEAGRLEITLTDGTLLHLDRFTEIEIASDLVIRVARGRLLVTMKSNGGGSGDRLSVEAPGALARLDDDGQYRVTVGGAEAAEVELAVLNGSAELVNDGGAVRVGTGERSRVHDGEAPSRAQSIEAAETTALERWADELLSTHWQGVQPSQTYLPSELSTYAGTFDRYGSWQSDATYGHVWYPTVAVDWRPYYNGRWDHMRRYGWTWIASDPWGYPTHHYGRWQLSMRGSWFWIPSRTWGPAWVYWATTPTYIGWCPLGWNGRPVLNVFSYGRSVHTYSRWRDPHRAWTVLPIRSFGRTHVSRSHVDRRILDRDRPTFAMRHLAPGYALTRRPTSQRADGGWSNYRAYERRMQERRTRGAEGTRGTSYGRGSVDRGRSGDRGSDDRGADSRRPDARGNARVTDPGGSSQAPDNGSQNDRGTVRTYGAPSRSPYGSTYRRVPQTQDGAREGSGGNTGWSNYREYERRMQERNSRSGNADDDRGRSYRRDGADRSGSDESGADRPSSRAPAYRGPDRGSSRPSDPGPRPDSGRSVPRYTSPPDRGGDRGGGGSPRSSGGSSGGEARRGDSGGSRGGDGGGSRGGGAPRRRP